MATTEVDGVEPERAEPCILSVMHEPVRARATTVAARALPALLAGRARRARRWDKRQPLGLGLLLCCHVRLMIGWQRAHHLYVGSLRAGAAGAGGKRENQEWPVDGFSLSPLLAVVRRACGPVAVWSGLRCLCCPCAVMRAFFQYFWPV